MENKGITKKQLRIQIASMSFNMLMGFFWFIWGLLKKNTWMWVLGILFILLTAGSITSLVVQRRRYPLEDEEVDKRITRDFKDGLVALGIFFGTIALALLLAFGLIAIFK